MSRNWEDGNWLTAQGLGEDLDVKQKWYRGDRPPIVPNAHTLGSDSCFANGEQFSEAMPSSETCYGFPLQCYAPTPDGDPSWNLASTFTLCQIQFFYATILKWMYERDEQRIGLAFQMLCGDRHDLTFHWSGGNMPDVVTVVTPDWSIVVIGGTLNYQQFALQAFQSIVGPRNFGTYSTLPLWYNASVYVNELLAADGANPLQPIFLCGHSYGAATATNLAARYKAARPARELRYLFFGCPKIGDQRLVDLMVPLHGASIVNDGDWVGVLPPDVIALFPVQIAIPLVALGVWTQWLPAQARYLQNEDGSMVANGSPTLTFPQLLFFAQQVILGIPIAEILPHRITSYRNRIDLRCPLRDCPISAPLWLWLHEVPIPEGFVELNDAGETIWPDGALYLNTKPDPASGGLGLAAGKHTDGSIELTAIAFLPTGSVGLAPGDATSGGIGLDDGRGDPGSVGLNIGTGGVGPPQNCFWCSGYVPFTIRVTFDCPDLPNLHGLTQDIDLADDPGGYCNWGMTFYGHVWGTIYIAHMQEEADYPDVRLVVGFNSVPYPLQFDADITSDDWTCFPYECVFTGTITDGFDTYPISVLCEPAP